MVGSSTSGSSASPIRSVDWAWTLAANGSSSAAAVITKRRSFIVVIPISTLRYSRPGACLINPGAAHTFRAATEGSDQFFQRRRKPAVGRNDIVGRRQFRRAVTGGGVSGSLGEQRRHLSAAALDYVGAAGVKAAT